MVTFVTTDGVYKLDPVTNRIKITQSSLPVRPPFTKKAWVQLHDVPDIVKGKRVGLMVDPQDRHDGFQATGKVVSIRKTVEVDEWHGDGEWIAVVA